MNRLCAKNSSRSVTTSRTFAFTHVYTLSSHLATRECFNILRAELTSGAGFQVEAA